MRSQYGGRQWSTIPIEPFSHGKDFGRFSAKE